MTTSTTPETASQQEITYSLEHARDHLTALIDSAEFHAYLLDDGTIVDVNNPTSQEYWGAVAAYVNGVGVSQENKNPLDTMSLAIAGNLPNVLVHSYLLKNHAQNMTYSERKASKLTTIAFNELLRAYATDYPQSVHDLEISLYNTVISTIGAEKTDFTRHCEEQIGITLKGVKHELGYAKLLDELGVEYTQGTAEDDSKGRDIVIMFQGKRIGVDIKASLSEVDQKNHGSNGKPYALKPNGDIVMFSLLADKDFEGGFVPPPNVIEEKSAVFGGYLQTALMQAVRLL